MFRKSLYDTSTRLGGDSLVMCLERPLREDELFSLDSYTLAWVCVCVHTYAGLGVCAACCPCDKEAQWIGNADCLASPREGSASFHLPLITYLVL